MSLCTKLRSEFRRSNIGFTPLKQSDTCQGWVCAFGDSVFPCLNKSSTYVVVRVVLALFATSCLVYSIARSGFGGGYWFYFLTNWAYMLLTAYLITAAGTTVAIARNRQVCEPLRPPTYAKAALVLQDAAVTIGTMVTLMYWTLLFDGGQVEFWNFNVHGLNAIIIFVDLTINNQPFLLGHVWVPGFVALLYTIWSLIHYALRIEGWGCYCIYSVLDWGKNPTLTALLLLGAFIGTHILVLFIWLYKYGLVPLMVCGEANIVQDIESQNEITQDDKNQNGTSLEPASHGIPPSAL